jgi:predicted Fe-Mo cluster-binding NifX family protein
MKIAVCSQNRRTVTAHAGRCRNFLVFEIDADKIGTPAMLEVSIEQTLHALAGNGAPHPLDGVNVLLAASMGHCVREKLAQRGILGLITDEEDPVVAIRRYMRGELPDMIAATERNACSCSH